MCIYVFVVSFHWTNRETFNLYPDNTTAAHPRRWWAQMPKGNLFRVRAKFQKKKGRSTDLFFPKGLYPTKSLVISGVLSSKFKRIKLESNSYIVIFLYIYVLLWCPHFLGYWFRQSIRVRDKSHALDLLPIAGHSLAKVLEESASRLTCQWLEGRLGNHG